VPSDRTDAPLARSSLSLLSLSILALSLLSLSPLSLSQVIDVLQRTLTEQTYKDIVNAAGGPEKV
jgi:hypothetical protein